MHSNLTVSDNISQVFLLQLVESLPLGSQRPSTEELSLRMLVCAHARILVPAQVRVQPRFTRKLPSQATDRVRDLDQSALLVVLNSNNREQVFGVLLLDALGWRVVHALVTLAALQCVTLARHLALSHLVNYLVHVVRVDVGHLVHRRSRRVTPPLVLVPDVLQLLVNQIFVVVVSLVECAVHVGIATTLRGAIVLNLKLIFFAELQQVLLSLLEAEGSWDLVVHVQLNRLENHIPLGVDHVSKPIDQVSPTIDLPFLLVEQLATSSSHNDEVSEIVNLEFSHDVRQLEVGNLLLRSKRSLLRFLSTTLLAKARRLTIRYSIDDVVDQTLRVVLVNLSLVLHENLHITLL